MSAPWSPPEVTADHLAVADRIAGGVGHLHLHPPTNPKAVADQLLAERYVHRDPATGAELPTLHHHDGTWWEWTPRAGYTEVELGELNRRWYDRLGDAQYVQRDATGVDHLRAWLPTKAKLGQLEHAFASRRHLSREVRAPAWLGPLVGAGPSPFVGPVMACQNGLVDLGAPGRPLRPHTPAWWGGETIQAPYDPNASAPVAFLAFLAEVFQGDQESIDAVRMMLGYLLSGRREQQRAFLLLGPPRSGKGTLGRIIEALFGDVAAPSLSDLATQFGLAPLIGRSVAVIGDARLSGRSDVSMLVERILSITGEDVITIDRKHREPWVGRLPTRFVVATNELPRLTDTSGAVLSRFIVLSMRQSFVGREDRGLFERLRAELPSILRWSVEGLALLDQQGGFQQPAASREALGVLHEAVSPVGAFVEQCCVVMDGAWVWSSQLYAAYDAWARKNGQQPKPSNSFGRELLAVVPSMTRGQATTPEGKRERTVRGIGLLAPPTAMPAAPLTLQAFVQQPTAQWRAS